jgi:carbon-monoxide dehydrogenase large subunit
MKYDDAGQPLSTNLAEYVMPGSGEVPRCEITHVETPSPLNPLGVKGAGEGGTIPAPAAIVAAIENALAPFGVRFTECPLTPERVARAVQASRGSRAA